MLVIRCKNCNSLVNSKNSTTSCGCENLTMIHNQTISAKDLSLVEIVSGVEYKKSNIEYQYLTKEDLEWMENRKSRKVKKLNFEVR